MTPHWSSPNTPSQPSLLWELGHFCTPCCRRPPAHERAAAMIDTSRQGRLRPPPPAPDLALTSVAARGAHSCTRSGWEAGRSCRLARLGGAPLQLPGLGHHGRDMLLFLILFFYEKNQCQSTDPLRNPAGRAQPAAPISPLGLRGSAAGGRCRGGGTALQGPQGRVGPGPGAPSPPKGSPHT